MISGGHTLPPPPPPPQVASAQSPAPPLPTATSSKNSLSNLDASSLSCHPNHGSNKLPKFNQFTSLHEGTHNFQGGSEFEKAGSLARDGVSSNGSVMLEFSSPPPMPSNDIGHKIDSISQLSAMNDEGKTESPSKSFQIDLSSQPDQFMVTSGYSLPSDSDMEMEDDITLSDGNQEVHNSSDPLNRKSDINHGELDVRKHLHGAESSPEWTDPQGVLFEKVPSSLFECHLIIQRAPSRFDIRSTGASESSLASEQKKFSIPKADDQNKLDASAAVVATNPDGFSNHITVNSPFRLLQDYASENSSEDGDVGIPPSSVTTNVKCSAKDAGSQFEIGSKNPCMTDKMSGLQYESRRSKLSLDTKKELRSTDTTLIIDSHESFQGKDALNGSPIDNAFNRDKSQEGKKTKSECLPKVDEYGRLVRDGSSDSNSDGSRYNKRHKRGRSRSHSRSCKRSRTRSCNRSQSRSRSPLDTRRSPQRRREMRNCSPSRVSRNQRGRSRCPTFRCADEFRDENKRQDRRHIPECFDFLRGKCSRGGSCRYMHREHDRNDGSWRHRNQQKHLVVHPSVMKSRILEGIEASLVSDSPPDRTSKTSPYKVSSIEPTTDAILSTQSRPAESSNAQPLSSGQFSSQFLVPKESPLPSFSAANSPYPSQLPPPPLSQGTSVAHVPQLHRDYSQRPPYPVQSIPTGIMHAYQGPLSNQPSQFPVSQDSTWPSLLPSPPKPPYDSSHSFAQGHTHPQPTPPSQELTRIKKQNFSGDNFQPGECLNSSSQIHPHSHNQQPSNGVGDSLLGVPGKTGVQYPVGGSILGFPGKDGPMSRYPPDMPDRSQFSQVPDFGASRVQTHHNPYTATFEQPLSFKFSSNILIEGRNTPAANMFDTPAQFPADGQGVGSAGSRQTTSSLSSGAVGQLLRKSVSEQYDPLLDSIEPSGNPVNKHDQSQKHTATNDSNMMVRFSSCEPLDVEENKKHIEGYVDKYVKV